MIEYERKEKGVRKLERVNQEALEERRQCWYGIRAAAEGQKRVKSVAHKLDWLELPEHIEYMLESKDEDARNSARTAADKYYKRTPFDESLKTAKSIVLGSIFREDTSREGLEGGFTIADLDAAEISEGSWSGTEKFLTDERFTTGYVASYIFLREGDIPTVKHFCAENIIDICENDGQRTRILLREAIDKDDDDAINDDEPGYRFRELEIDEGVVVERIWVSTDENNDEYRASEESGEPIVLCLLYTSPSPRDQRGSRMPSSA